MLPKPKTQPKPPQIIKIYINLWVSRKLMKQKETKKELDF